MDRKNLSPIQILSCPRVLKAEFFFALEAQNSILKTRFFTIEPLKNLQAQDLGKMNLKLLKKILMKIEILSNISEAKAYLKR